MSWIDWLVKAGAAEQETAAIAAERDAATEPARAALDALMDGLPDRSIRTLLDGWRSGQRPFAAAWLTVAATDAQPAAVLPAAPDREPDAPLDAALAKRLAGAGASGDEADAIAAEQQASTPQLRDATEGLIAGMDQAALAEALSAWRQQGGRFHQQLRAPAAEPAPPAQSASGLGNRLAGMVPVTEQRIPPWSGRVAALGASASEQAAIQLSYDDAERTVRDALDQLIAGIDNVGLLTMLNTWRAGAGPFGDGFPGGGLPFGTHVAILSGNPSDDQKALSAGTGQKLTAVLPAGAAAATVPEADGAGGYAWVSATAAGALAKLPIQPPVTTSGAAVVGAHNQVDATSAPISLSLPAGQPLGTLINVEKIDASANVVTATGSIRGVGSSTDTLSIKESILYEADSSGSWWPIAGHKRLSAMDARYVNLASVDAAIPPRIRVSDVEIDLCRPWTDGVTHYAGVSPGQDITTQLQAAINFIATLSSGGVLTGGTVFISQAGTYQINGAQVSGTAVSGTYGYSAQVLFPAISLANATVPIKIKGPSATVAQGSNGCSPGGVILQSSTGGNTPIATTTSGIQSFPESTVTVASTTGFPSSGLLEIAGVKGFVYYSGLTGTTFTGCVGGANSSVASGQAVNLCTSVVSVIQSYVGSTNGLSNIEPIFDNVSVSVPLTDPQCNGLMLWSAAKAFIDRQSIFTLGNPNVGLTGVGCGLRMPGLSNSGQSTVRDLTINGFPNGLIPGEHGRYEGYQQYAACNNMIKGGGAAIPNKFNNATGQGCHCMFYAPDTDHKCVIEGIFHYEASGSTEILLCNDPVNQFVGQILLHVTSMPGSGAMPSVGGQNLDVRMWSDPSTVYAAQRGAIGMGHGPGTGWMGSHPTDTFVRTNTSANAAAVPGACSPTGHPWFVSAGSFGISQATSNGIITSTAGSGGATALVPALEGGLSRTITWIVNTQSGAFQMNLYGHNIQGGGGGSNGGHLIALNLFNNNIRLLLPTSTVRTATGVLAASTTYAVSMELSYGIVVVGGLIYNVPVRVRTFLNGARVAALDYFLSATEQAEMAPTWAGGAAPFPIVYDGFNFTNDTVSTITGFKVSGFADAADLNPAASIALPTYGGGGAPVAINAPDASWQTITVTDSSAFTISAPTNPPTAAETEELTVEISNTSGGAMGTITWNAAFVFAGQTWTNPASTKKRNAVFRWNGTKWVCRSVAAADY